MSDSPISDEQLDRLYQQLEQEQPPADLDAEIRAQARKPLQPEAPNVTPIRRHSTRRWAIPLSTAAVMVLGLSLFYRAYEQQTTAPAPAAVPKAESLQESAPPASGSAGALAPRADRPMAEEKARAREAAPMKKRLFMKAPPAPASVQAPEAARETTSDQAAPAEAPVMGLMSRAQVQQEESDARRMMQTMETLLRKNRLDLLEKTYSNFRKKYPHYPLSPALQEWYKRQHPPKTSAPGSQAR